MLLHPLDPFLVWAGGGVRNIGEYYVTGTSVSDSCSLLTEGGGSGGHVAIRIAIVAVLGTM